MTCKFRAKREITNTNRKRNGTHETLLARARRCAPPSPRALDSFRLDLFGIALSSSWRRKTLVVAVNSAREGMPWEGAEIDCVCTRVKEAAATFFGAEKVDFVDDWEEGRERKERGEERMDGLGGAVISIQCVAVARVVATFPRALVAFSISAVGGDKGEGEEEKEGEMEEEEGEEDKRGCLGPASFPSTSRAVGKALSLSTRWLLGRRKIPTNASDKCKRVATYAAQVLLEHDAVALHEPGFHFVLPRLLSSARPLFLACLDGGDNLQSCELRRRFGGQDGADARKARGALGLGMKQGSGGLVLAHRTAVNFQRGSFAALALFSEGGYADWLRRWRGVLAASLERMGNKLVVLVLLDYSGLSKLVDEVAAVAEAAFGGGGGGGGGGGVMSVERAVSFVSAGRKLGFCSLLFTRATAVAVATGDAKASAGKPLPVLMATQDAEASLSKTHYSF